MKQQTPQRILNKWKKLFKSGVEIEFKHKGKDWTYLAWWNLQEFPELHFKFRKKK